MFCEQKVLKRSSIYKNVENDITMKKLLFISIGFFLWMGCTGPKETSSAAGDKIKDCPEMMIDNRMPRIIDENAETTALPSQYYIYKGERREMAEFDTAWVNRNCDVEVEVVY